MVPEVQDTVHRTGISREDDMTEQKGERVENGLIVDRKCKCGLLFSLRTKDSERITECHKCRMRAPVSVRG